MTVFSDAEYTEWLAAPRNVPVTLIIAEHDSGTVYFGSYGYTSTPDDDLPNRHFEDLLLDRVEIVESISEATIGDISVINDGTHEDWLGFNWRGFPIKIYLGDARWSFDNYRLIVDGRNGGISAPATNRYRFSILDPNEDLELQIGTDIAPLSFGETYNVRPPMIDSGTLRYKVNDGVVGGIVVRDNGIVLAGGGGGYTEDLSNGEFDLVASPAGQITVDVSEAATQASDIIARICALVPVANLLDRIWDISDALLDPDRNTTSTVFAGLSNAVVTTPAEGDQDVVTVEGNTTPTAASRGYVLITALSTVNPSNGDLVIIRGQIKHVGTGGAWSLRVADASDLATTYTEILSVSSTDIAYQSFALAFTFSAAASGLDHFGAIEDNGSNDGGVTIKDVEFFHAGVPINSTNFAAFPNTVNLGLYVQQPTPAGELIRLVMESVGGSFRFNTLGEIEIFRLELPPQELHTDANAAGISNEFDAITGWTNTGLPTFVSQSVEVNESDYAINAVANSNGDLFYKDIQTDFGLTNGDVCRLKCDVKHNGTGGDWAVRLTSDNSLSADITLVGVITSTDTEFQTYIVEFTHSANTRYFGARENSGTNDGEIYFDNFSLKIATALVLTSDDIFSIEDSGIKHLGNEPPIRKMELGYQKNWHVQSADSLAGAVTIQNREDMSKDFRYVEKINSLAAFPLATDKRIESLFELEADAQTEINRRQLIRSEKRDNYLIRSFLATGQISIGESMTIGYPDYGFNLENNVIVLETRRLLGRNRIDLVVWQ